MPRLLLPTVVDCVQKWLNNIFIKEDHAVKVKGDIGKWEFFKQEKSYC